MDFKPYTHYCKYYVLKKSMRSHMHGQSWYERCKCGRTIWIDCKFYVEGRNSPQITKTWFDREGNIERVTGHNAKIDGNTDN